MGGNRYVTTTWALLGLALVGNSSANTTLQLKPFKGSIATQSGCTAVGLDFECETTPGTELEFSIWIDVDSDGFAGGSFGLQWDDYMQNQLDLTSTMTPIQSSIEITPGPPPVVVAFSSNPPSSVQESADNQPGQVGLWSRGAFDPWPEAYTLVAGHSFRAGRATFSVQGTDCETAVHFGFDGSGGGNQVFLRPRTGSGGDGTTETFVPDFGEVRLNVGEPISNCIELPQIDADGDGTPEYGFELPVTISTSLAEAEHVIAADIDGDLDIDILAGGGGQIVWFENTNQNASQFAPEQAITAPTDDERVAVLVDFDGDSDADIITRSIGWFENTDGAGNFSALQSLVTPTETNWGDVTAGDFDGDGDADIAWGYVAPDPLDFLNGMGWYENLDGSGTMGPFQAVGGVGVSALVAANFDLNPSIDLLQASILGIQLNRNQDGAGSFGSGEYLPPNPTGPIEANLNMFSLEVADFDDDGDADFSLTVRATVPPSYLFVDAFSWYENFSGSFFFRHEIEWNVWNDEPGAPINDSATGSLASVAADFDDDGDLDLALARLGAVQWYANENGEGNFGALRAIAADENDPFLSIDAGDLNGDGRADLLVGSSLGTPLQWYAQIVPDNCPTLPNPDQADTDGDGTGDACEDSDEDGLLDDYETNTNTYVSPTDTGSDPANADSDGDGIDDGIEVATGLDPNVAESALPALSVGPLTLAAVLLAITGLARIRRHGTALRC